MSRTSRTARTSRAASSPKSSRSASGSRRGRVLRAAVCFPPIKTDKGVALLSQNRQFQYFNTPTFIYPMVPAYAATMLKERGFDVRWMDGIAEQKDMDAWLDELAAFDPDVLLVESKTPTIKHYWRAIAQIKERLPKTVVALAGDHVTAEPKESLVHSKVDYVITGGDFDFLFVNLAEHLRDGKPLEAGFYFRKNGKITSTGVFKNDHEVKDLPMVDRALTKWKLYAYCNGNYKYTPGTYLFSGRDCWWRKDGGCTFCSWTTTYPTFRVRTPEQVVDEVGHLIDLGVKEVFDDTGTFPIGPWLEKFCNLMVERGYHKKITFGCNMRVNALSQEQYDMMGRAGFRFILYGIESANQHTLDKLVKGNKVEDIERGVRMAKKAGLDPHLTCMIGYPWESFEDAKRTIALAKYLFEKGYADTLQATIVMPYPGTPLFREARERGWLTTEDWDEYDMRKPVMKTPMTEAQIVMLTNELYRVFFAPRYVLRKVLSIRSADDLRFIKRGVKSLWGHLTDFSVSKKKETVASR